MTITWKMLLIMLLSNPLTAGEEEPKSCCRADQAASEVETSDTGATTVDLKIPDIPVLDENGNKLRLYSDLIRGKKVAVSFIFTTCTTICPPIGANFAKLEKELAGSGVQLISISVDPNTDTPKRLKAWKAKFGGGSDWTLVTGSKLEVDKALKAMQFFTADKTDHSPFLLLGNDLSGHWRRVNGFTEPTALADLLEKMKTGGEKAAASETPVNAAHRYFTDVPLVDQSGKTRHLYSDLMQGKVIVMQSFFASCTGVCPKTVGAFSKIQEHLGDRLGKEVAMLSISVDPTRDTPERLKDYATEWQARPGWFFLTGTPENVQTALHKFGQKVDAPEGHSNVFIMGNDTTGLWKKAMGLSDSQSIIGVLDTVLDDTGVGVVNAPN